MTKKQIKEFLNELNGERACNFRKDKKGNFKWDCNNDFTFSKKILSKMGIKGKEQKEFLEKCESHGGYCDCEILFNAEEALLRK